MRKCQISNERGLTLVEVLASLVILGILFVGIMTIFPQMTLFNEKTEAKLDTMNLARQEMAKISDGTLWVREYDSSIGQAPGFLPVTGPVTSPDITMESVMAGLSYYVDASDPGTADYKRFYNTSSAGYLFMADIYLLCEKYQKPDPALPSPPLNSCAQQDTVKLHKMHLKVLLETQIGSGTYRKSSETFSFIPYKEKNIN